MIVRLSFQVAGNFFFKNNICGIFLPIFTFHELNNFGQAITGYFTVKMSVSDQTVPSCFSNKQTNQVATAEICSVEAILT